MHPQVPRRKAYSNSTFQHLAYSEQQRRNKGVDRPPLLLAQSSKGVEVAAGRQPQRTRVHKRPPVSDANGRGDPQDKITQIDPQDAAVEPSILNKAAAGHPSKRPQEDDLLRISIIIKI